MEWETFKVAVFFVNVVALSVHFRRQNFLAPFSGTNLLDLGFATFILITFIFSSLIFSFIPPTPHFFSPLSRIDFSVLGPHDNFSNLVIFSAIHQPIKWHKIFSHHYISSYFHYLIFRHLTNPSFSLFAPLAPGHFGHFPVWVVNPLIYPLFLRQEALPDIHILLHD